MLIHPSLIEKANLDAREYNADVAADIKRSFTYVGPITVGSHEEDGDDAPVRNEMHLICRMSKPYWTSEGDGDQMWDAMRTWLEAKEYKVKSTIANFNKSRAEKGHQTVDYDRVELDMKPYAFGIACPEDDDLADFTAIASRVRELLATGVLPADMLGIEAPSAASLAEQSERAHAEAAARAEAQAQAAAQEAAVQVEGAGAAGPEGEGAGDEAVTQGASAQAAAGGAGEKPADAASDPAAQTAEAPADDAQAVASPEPAPATPARLPHASDCLANIDYTLWDVRLADGTVRTLDSVAGSWA